MLAVIIVVVCVVGGIPALAACMRSSQISRMEELPIDTGDQKA